jgi:hypothetical protein
MTSRNAREGHYGGKQAMYAMVLVPRNSRKKWEREKMVWKKYYRTYRALSLKGMRKSEEDVFGGGE